MPGRDRDHGARKPGSEMACLARRREGPLARPHHRSRQKDRAPMRTEAAAESLRVSGRAEVCQFFLKLFLCVDFVAGIRRNGEMTQIPL
jgi:hypothetical protein